MGILMWIILGAFAGWLASKITHNNNTLMWDIILGIGGSVVGGYIISIFGHAAITGFNFYSLVVAIFGAVILIAVGRRLRIGYE